MKSIITTILLSIAASKIALAQNNSNFIVVKGSTTSIVIIVAILLGFLGLIIYKYLKFRSIAKDTNLDNVPDVDVVLQNLNAQQIDNFIKLKQENDTQLHKETTLINTKNIVSFIGYFFIATVAMAQNQV